MPASTVPVNEDYYRALVQSLHDAVISMDQDGVILSWNQGAQACFGYTADEMLGRSVQHVMPACCWHDGSSGAIELEGIHRKGDRFPVEVSLSSWIEQGRRHVAAVLRDITARKKAVLDIEHAYHTRILISALLETSLEPLTLEQQLEVSLDILHSLPWLSRQSKGAIFLVDEANQTLQLVAQRGFSDQHQQLCHQVAFGQCLCGQTAVTRQMTLVRQVDERHALHPESMQPHGHYCVPITLQGRLLGVLNLYVEEGHCPHPEEENMLTLVANTLAGIIEHRLVESRLQQLHRDLRTTRLEIIRRLGVAAEYRDNETGMHVIRMSHYAALLGKSHGLDERACEVLLNASPMHDVGKIGIPDRLLLKPGRLSRQEFEIMKSHTLIGGHMLLGHDEEPLATAYVIAMTHHEKWDGTGYPNGLSGNDIPLAGRICAIADVFDALTSERPYKKAWSIERAMAEVERCSDSHFDPDLVGHLRALLPDIIEIQRAYADVNSAHLIHMLDQIEATTTAASGPSGDVGMTRVPLANWNNIYDIGVANIDQEHRTLVHWVNRLNHAIRADREDQVVDEILAMLTHYVQSHFSHEEALMERCHYPDLTAHRAQHEAFAQQVKERIRQLPLCTDSGSRSQAAIDLLHFLTSWLFNHIGKVDRAIGLFLRETY
ncbi:MAG: bacteriohemerythrin [Magnetococcales bacterium]|nr:bacteriohemerythrin [Magnetococcales bacterium]